MTKLSDIKRKRVQRVATLLVIALDLDNDELEDRLIEQVVETFYTGVESELAGEDVVEFMEMAKTESPKLLSALAYDVAEIGWGSRAPVAYICAVVYAAILVDIKDVSAFATKKLKKKVEASILVESPTQAESSTPIEPQVSEPKETPQSAEEILNSVRKLLLA